MAIDDTQHDQITIPIITRDGSNYRAFGFVPEGARTISTVEMFAKQGGGELGKSDISRLEASFSLFDESLRGYHLVTNWCEDRHCLAYYWDIETTEWKRFWRPKSFMGCRCELMLQRVLS